MSVFQSMVNQLSSINDDSLIDKISKKQYEAFRQQWIIDALKGLRYGQSFCNFFNISNATPLYYFKDNRFAEKWIESHWVKS